MTDAKNHEYSFCAHNDQYLLCTQGKFHEI